MLSSFAASCNAGILFKGVIKFLCWSLSIALSWHLTFSIIITIIITVIFRLSNMTECKDSPEEALFRLFALFRCSLNSRPSWTWSWCWIPLYYNLWLPLAFIDILNQLLCRSISSFRLFFNFCFLWKAKCVCINIS